MKRQQRKYSHSIYPVLSYLVVIMLGIALYFQPEHFFGWVVTALSVFIVLLGLYNYRQKHVHPDSYLEYLVIILAALVVLLGAIVHR